jgi:deoxycytidine triphosphate deaminase
MKHIMGPQSSSTLSNVRNGDVQPNAVDLRVGNIFLIRPATFTITEEEKTHRGSVALKPGPDGFYVLSEGHYEVVMENIIEVGEGEAGWVITRSTLNRNGVFLTSGLYDTGYHGVMAAVMHVTCGPMRIKKGTRIGQYLSFNAEALHKYDGSYGIGKDHDAKYEATPVPTATLPEFTQAPKITMFDIQPPTQPQEQLNEQTQEQSPKRRPGRPKKVG